MSSRAPSFLLGGINKTYNFLGQRTVTTSAYGIFETGLKLSPVLLGFGLAARTRQQFSLADAIKVDDAKATDVRRTSLSQ